MMTSSNGNIFRVTGPLCGEFTGPGEFPTQRPVTRSCDVFFDLHLNKRLSKQPSGWWFETPSWSLWHHCNVCRHQYSYQLSVSPILEKLPLFKCHLLAMNHETFEVNHNSSQSVWILLPSTAKKGLFVFYLTEYSTLRSYSEWYIYATWPYAMKYHRINM